MSILSDVIAAMLEAREQEWHEVSSGGDCDFLDIGKAAEIAAVAALAILDDGPSRSRRLGRNS